jgi:hypothetical protein
MPPLPDVAPSVAFAPPATALLRPLIELALFTEPWPIQWRVKRWCLADAESIVNPAIINVATATAKSFFMSVSIETGPVKKRDAP